MLLTLVGFRQHFGFTVVSFCYLLLIILLGSSYLRLQRIKQLYDLAQQLLALEPEGKAKTMFMEPFCGIFGITAVCLYDADTAEFHSGGASRDWLAAQTRQAYIDRANTDDAQRKVSFRCIRLGDRAVGAVGFENLDEPALTAGQLTALAAAFLQRIHAFRSAKQASDAAQSEEYRTVILHGLAHEFKTPLSTILAAAGAIREAGSLGPEHREMAETVELEAARLGRLTSRLIRTARLEREEIKPWMELIDIGAVVTNSVRQYSKLSAERCITVLQRSNSSEVFADPELIQLAVSQLLDNACKYSSASFPVTVIVSRQDGQIVLRVLSSGTPIRPDERNRIFDRFYRGTEARRLAPGTGLGLYVARKIALAHGGSLDLDDDPPSREWATFRLTIPAAQSERDDAPTV